MRILEAIGADACVYALNSFTQRKSADQEVVDLSIGGVDLAMRGADRSAGPTADRSHVAYVTARSVSAVHSSTWSTHSSRFQYQVPRLYIDHISCLLNFGQLSHLASFSSPLICA